MSPAMPVRPSTSMSTTPASRGGPGLLLAAALPVALAVAIVVYAVASLRALPPAGDVAAWDHYLAGVRDISTRTLANAFLLCLAVLAFSLAALRFGGAAGRVMLAAGLCLSLVAAGLVYEVHRTALNPDFLATQIAGADAGAIVKDMAGRSLTPDLADAVAKTLNEERTWVDQTTRQVLGVTFEYLHGRTDTLVIPINPAPLLTTLLKHLSPSLLATMPPEATAEERQAALEQMQDNMADQAKAMADRPFDIRTLSKDQQASIASARDLMPYVRWTTIGVIALVVQFALLLLLLGAPRWIGGSALVAGLVLLIATFVAPGPINAAVAARTATLPAALRDYLPALVAHLMMPLRVFGGACAVIGLLLVALGRRRSSPVSAG